jgi:AraC-like DNA-binding protein
MGIINSYRFVSRVELSTSREYEILPDGYFDLSFLLSESTCKILLAGPYTKRKNVPLGTSELIIVHFQAGLMPNLADIHARELVNSMIELPYICGLDGDTIGEALLERNTTGLRIAFIENILRNVEVFPASSDRIYDNAIALINARDGLIQVGELARSLNVSNRTLERKFNNFLGFSPKKFIQLVRFQKVIETMRSNTTPGCLSDIAYKFGYFDQSHYIRDFKQMSDVLPGSFCR